MNELEALRQEIADLRNEVKSLRRTRWVTPGSFGVALVALVDLGVAAPRQQTPPQDQPDEVRSREVELLAPVDPILLQPRDDEAIQIVLEPIGIVDAIEKTWRGVVEIVAEHAVDTGVELQKPYLGAGAIGAFCDDRRRAPSGKPCKRRADTIRIAGVLDPPTQFAEDLPQISNPDSVIVAAGADPVSLGIAEPTDADVNDTLIITVTSLPDYGTIEYFDGASYVPITATGTMRPSWRTFT